MCDAITLRRAWYFQKAERSYAWAGCGTMRWGMEAGIRRVALCARLRHQPWGDSPRFWLQQVHHAFKGGRGQRQIKNGEARQRGGVGEVPGVASMLGINCWACSPRAVSGRGGEDHSKAQSTAGLKSGEAPGEEGASWHCRKQDLTGKLGRRWYREWNSGGAEKHGRAGK